MRRLLSFLAFSGFVLVGLAQQVIISSPSDGGGEAALISKASSDQFEVEVSSYGVSTLYLDFPVAIPNDGNLLGIYYVYSLEKKEARLTRIWNYIPANTGVVVLANSGKYTFYRTDADVPPLAFTNYLTGSTVDISRAKALADAGASSEAKIMTLGQGSTGYIGFYQFTGSKLKANKAFIINDKATDANSLPISGLDEDLSIVHIDENSNRHDVWYTIQGVRLSGAPIHQGIYICNGKTVVVK